MEKIKRLFFCVLYYGCARHLPSSVFPGGGIFKALRYQICRQLFAACGTNVNVEKGASFHSGSNVRIGKNSGIGINAEIGGAVEIGDNVMMGPNCVIITRNHKIDRTDIPMCEQHFSESRPVLIGDDVWIGQNVIILPGVKIGKGSIIGAGTVVPKNIPEYSVAVGNPAKVVKSRLKDAAKKPAETAVPTPSGSSVISTAFVMAGRKKANDGPQA